MTWDTPIPSHRIVTWGRVKILIEDLQWWVRGLDRCGMVKLVWI